MATKLPTKNTCGKMRPASNPYEVWICRRTGWTYRVLKKWQGPAAEAKNPYARWFCEVDGFAREMGDVYVSDIKGTCDLVETNY